MGNVLLNQLLHSEAELALCWLGNLSWLIAVDGNLIAFDLDLDLDLRLQPSPIGVYDIAEVLDILFITHEHGDHFNAQTATVLAGESACKFVLPENCTEKAHRIGIPNVRIKVAHPEEPFELMGLHVHPLRALHGDKKHAVYRHANMDDCGYLLTIAGRRLLQPGDTVLLQDHLELSDIDILFVSPTEHNMHIDASVTLIQTLQPSFIFPQHYATYQQNADNRYWTQGYPDEVKARLPENLKSRYIKLSQGEIFSLPDK